MRLWMIRALGMLCRLHVSPYVVNDGVRRQACIGVVVALNVNANAAIWAHEKGKP